MTGWRLGWIVVPEGTVETVAKLAQNLYICPPSVAQHAALAAFDPPAMAVHEARRKQFARRRQRLVDGLEALGFQLPLHPQGAFYVYVDVAHTGLSSVAFASVCSKSAASL